MDSARAIALTAVLLAASVPLGAALLRFFRFRPADFGDHLELAAVALSAGLGVHGLILTLLGLAHVLYPAAVIAVPLTLGALTVPLALPLWRWPRGPAIDGACEAVACPRPSNSARVLRPATIAALAVVAIAILIQDLAPPTDYDGLLYHLVAPRAFLAAHAITYLRHNFSADLPAFGEMLYAFGLAASSERMPQLLHGATGVLCVLLTYCLGRITVGRRAAFWGSAALAATPLMPFLATRAYIDLFTLLFSLVALLAFVHWLTDRATRWLLLAGCGTGLALATKYAAATLVLVLGAAILVAAWRRVNCRSLFARLAAAAAPPIAFGAAAAAVALPWYARQTLALGNPVWPMYAGGAEQREWGIRGQQKTQILPAAGPEQHQPGGDAAEPHGGRAHAE